MYKKMEGIWAHCCLLAKEGAKEPPTMAATERLGMGKWVILYLSTLASMFAGSIVVHHVEKPDLVNSQAVCFSCTTTQRSLSSLCLATTNFVSG